MNLDTFAFEVYRLCPQALSNIGRFFGNDCLTFNEGVATGVDRGKLGKAVFQSKEHLQTLTGVTSPEIKRLMLEHFSFVEQHKDKYDLIAVEGAILIEA